ncbi:MAG: tyramine oxidase, partial [Thermoanaerobaculia bacterium]|nr:tyramine oxidase [Thermoanaerobaculia bacterium]
MTETIRSRTASRVGPALVLAFLAAGPAPAADHPLDALDAAEIAAAAALLRDAGHADDGTLFVAISLEEPPKSAVLAWNEGDAIPRAARAVLRRNGATVRAIVDLVAGRVLSAEEVPGAQPNIAAPELIGGMTAALGDARMQEGLAKRGIDDLDQLFCAPRTVGNFGREEEMTRRLVKVDCFDTRGIVTDVFAKPIEGL